MDDDSCVMKYIEIVPLEKSEDNSNVTDVKCEPLGVQVHVVFSSSILYIYIRLVKIAHFLRSINRHEKDRLID